MEQPPDKVCIFNDRSHTAPICCSLSELGHIELRMVWQTPDEHLWDHLIRRHHYLGYTQMAGARLKYLAFAQDRPLAALGWNSAAFKVEARDCFIGWSEEQRKTFLPHIVNNNRFLILPWVNIPYLASHILARNVKTLPRDWYKAYGRDLLLLETFVDPQRFKGTCYRAANWIPVGTTKGSAKRGSNYYHHGKPKEIYLYVLNKQFRQEIGCQRRSLPRPSPRLSRQGEWRMIIRPEDWNPNLVPWVNLSTEDITDLADELVRFHQEFHDCLYRVEQHRLGLCYLQGLLSNLERKSAEPIALASLGPAGVRALQNFMTTYRWHEDKMLAKIQSSTASSIALPDGMITTDGCDFPKKGKESVGVARQYCGPLGKVDNCQSGVFIGYSSSKGYALIHRQLYMPQSWFTVEQQERRQKCQVPDDLTFMTKPEIAGKLIQEVVDTGLFPAQWLGCDAVFGSNHDFLNSLPENLWYFASVRSNTKIWLQRPQMAYPAYSGIGRPPLKKMRVLPHEPEALSLSELASHPECDWKPVVLAEGSKGPIEAHVALMRVIECHNDLPGKESWLFMRRNADGQIKFAFSNAPSDTPLEEFIRASTMRWPIEQCFETAKSHLGMDHYETRSWPAWHRHITYVMLAFLFLLRLHFLWKKNSNVDLSSGQTAGSGCIVPVQYEYPKGP